MCGIAGFKVNRSIDGKTIRQMVKALYHRGPDADGFYASGNYRAGMRRLAINDLKTGDQPLFNTDRSVTLFYNGEIYNSPQLRVHLEGKGYRFRTTSDGEVICHLYDEYGEELFGRLDGMFAAALWDKKNEKLVLARDIPGEKPLYYSVLSGAELVFASEIKSLKLFPGIDLSLDRQAIWDFPTFLWIPEPDTVYSSVKALMPGHMLIADASGIRLKKYPAGHHNVSIGHSDDSVIKETRRVVEDAIKSRLLSDVPVGAFLSSGLDSSIVATIARRNLSNLSTFTISFEDLSDPYHGSADESIAAGAYARKLGTRHHTVKAHADTFSGLLDTFCDYADQPFAVSSGFGLLAVARAAKEAGIKVLLSGDGADECFGGYSWYQYLRLPDPVAVAAGHENEDVSFQNFGMPLDSRLKRIEGYSSKRRAWAWHYYASEQEKRKLFSDDISADAISSLRFFSEYKADGAWTPEDFVRHDRAFYLTNEMLHKVDRMTMAFSIEGRAPFVAPSVLSLADKLNYDQMIKKDTLKWVLRRAFADILPKEVIDRPKHGFNVPIDHWLKNEWSYLLEEAFSSGSALSKHGFIREGSIEEAKNMLRDPVRLNGHTLFCYIMLNLWLERCA